MSVHQVRAKMEELVWTASIRIIVIAMLGIQEATVKLILTNARQVHVKTVEPAMMESVHILVVAFQDTEGTIAKQVISAYLYVSSFEIFVIHPLLSATLFSH